MAGVNPGENEHFRVKLYLPRVGPGEHVERWLGPGNH